MTDRRSSGGLTLLEVLLAVSIAVLLFGGVMGFYRYALAARQSLLGQAGLIEIRRSLMDRLTAELRCAARYDYLGMGVRGSSDRIQIITTTLPGPSVWQEQREDLGQVLPARRFDLCRVEYRPVVDEQNTDMPAVLGLERVEQTLLTEQLVDESGSSGQVRFITDRLRFLRFRYFDGSAWQDQWNDRRLPLAVEITLGCEPLPEGLLPEEYPGPTWQRVVYLPASDLQLHGDILQGLDEGALP